MPLIESDGHRQKRPRIRPCENTKSTKRSGPLTCFIQSGFPASTVDSNAARPVGNRALQIEVAQALHKSEFRSNRPWQAPLSTREQSLLMAATHIESAVWLTSSKGNSHSQEGRRDLGAGGAFVLGVCQVHKLPVEFPHFSGLLRRFESVHGRAIEPSEGFDEIARSFVKR